MHERTRVPFLYQNHDFSVKLMEWIGDVFYDILPEQGYEVREEQIYTAFQLADAFCKGEVHFAEAELGTGKTFAYLLTAIAYARYRKKPVIIACATTALQEQLAGPKGDIQILSQLLDLKVDARMAKDPQQYVCDTRVEELRSQLLEEPDHMLMDIESWLNQTQLGVRSEIPLVPDHVWRRIGWDESMDCDICDNRGYCKLVKARQHYKSAKDLIIVDHGVFFHDLWTRKDLVFNRKLPILPSYSGVIFDEGHSVLLPAAMKAGDYINKEEMEQIIYSLEQIQGARANLIQATLRFENALNEFFYYLTESIIADERSERLSVQIKDEVLQAGAKFRKTLHDLLLELQIDQELYIQSLPDSLIHPYEGQIERAMRALDRFCERCGTDTIQWVDKKDYSFWVVPKTLKDMLNQQLFEKGLPVVFTSATLSNQGDFSYLIRSLGLKKASKASVGSPFELEEKVEVYLPQPLPVNNIRETKDIDTLVHLLLKNSGRALVLTNSQEEVRIIRTLLSAYQLPFEMLWEDLGDRGYLVQTFREVETSVLVGSDFWEGIDIPGESLTLVIIWQLPFPSLDPLIEVRRIEAFEQGLDPVITIDYPEMGLKLKQGCGRLIRTKLDHGAIVIMEPCFMAPWESYVLGALPPNAGIKTIEEFF